MTFTPTLRPEFVYTWESQARQYPRTGKRGVRYFRGVISPTLHVDCLLYRDRWGNLLGILNRYPVANPHEEVGNVNIWVHPDHQRQGIGRALVEAALTRWEIDLDQQRFTPAGAALAERLRADGIV